MDTSYWKEKDDTGKTRKLERKRGNNEKGKYAKRK